MVAQLQQGHQISVLIVDDSLTYRTVLKRVLQGISSVSLIETATNGISALDKLSEKHFDLVLLDIEMPQMNGLETLRVIQQRYPKVGVVMVSAMNRTCADITITALEGGALEFVSKPDGNGIDENFAALNQSLAPIIDVFVQRHSPQQLSSQMAFADKKIAAVPHKNISFQPKVLVIGISTGGPNALNTLIPALPQDLGVPILIVQHMPPVFTQSLASSLNTKSNLSVKEAQHDEPVLANTVYIAPGGKQMLINWDERTQKRHIVINDDPPENNCRPSVDVLFRSTLKAYGKDILSVIMTGMGCDGMKGVKYLKEKTNCYCLTQTADTCVVYGMPKAVDDSGLSDEQVTLDNMAKRISQLVQGR